MKKTLIAVLMMAAAPAYALESFVDLSCEVPAAQNAPAYVVTSMWSLDWKPLGNGKLLYGSEHLQVSSPAGSHQTDGLRSMSAGAFTYLTTEQSLTGTIASRNEGHYISVTALYGSSLMKDKTIYFKAKVNFQKINNGNFINLINTINVPCTLTAR